MNFTEFLNIIKYAFTNLLTVISDTVNLLMGNNIIKLILMFVLFNFMLYILFYVLNFVPNVLKFNKTSDKEVGVKK